MEQIEKIQPITTKVSGHRVIISDKVFSEIIAVINKQTEAINGLIDKTNDNYESIETLDSSLKELANALSKL